MDQHIQLPTRIVKIIIRYVIDESKEFTPFRVKLGLNLASWKWFEWVSSMIEYRLCATLSTSTTIYSYISHIINPYCVWKNIRHIKCEKLDVNKCLLTNIPNNEELISVDHNKAMADKLDETIKETLVKLSIKPTSYRTGIPFHKSIQNLLQEREQLNNNNNVKIDIVFTMEKRYNVGLLIGTMELNPLFQLTKLKLWVNIMIPPDEMSKVIHIIQHSPVTSITIIASSTKWDPVQPPAGSEPIQNHLLSNSVDKPINMTLTSFELRAILLYTAYHSLPIEIPSMDILPLTSFPVLNHLCVDYDGIVDKFHYQYLVSLDTPLEFLSICLTPWLLPIRPLPISIIESIRCKYLKLLTPTGMREETILKKNKEAYNLLINFSNNTWIRTLRVSTIKNKIIYNSLLLHPPCNLTTLWIDEYGNYLNSLLLQSDKLVHLESIFILFVKQNEINIKSEWIEKFEPLKRLYYKNIPSSLNSSTIVDILHRVCARKRVLNQVHLQYFNYDSIVPHLDLDVLYKHYASIDITQKASLVSLYFTNSIN